MSFLGQRVGMTEAARLHFDSDLSRPRLWNVSLDHLKRSAGTTDLDDAHLGHTHQTFIPPSTTMSTPVTYELSSEARNSATLATSSGRPRRPNSVLPSISRAHSGSSSWARVALLSINPGEIELARIPYSRPSTAS